MNKALRSLPSWLAGLISVVVVLLVWEAVCRFGQVREVILPRPTLILKDLYGELGWYLSQALYTLGVTLAGFALAAVGGVLTAVALVSS
ncbi:MAG: ABC transporter permease, partial [Alcaligenes sp.]